MRPITEKDIELANKFYRCRKSLQSLYKDEYAAKVADWITFVKAAMNQHRCNEVEAVMKLTEAIQGMEGAGVSAMWIMAAALEIIESEKNEA